MERERADGKPPLSHAFDVFEKKDPKRSALHMLNSAKKLPLWDKV